MKYVVAVCTAIIFFTNTAYATTDPFIVQRFRKIVQLIKSDNAKELSKFVRYPLSRENPLPGIKNAAEFIAYYPTLFDAGFKTLLKQYSDSLIFEHNDAFGLVGGAFTGEIWLNEDGNISTINYSSKKEQDLKKITILKIKNSMHPTVNNWDDNIIVAKSDKLLIRVDRTGKGIRYACWSKGKTFADVPDLILYNGKEEAQGTMGGWTWTFINKDWTYIVDEVDICDTPENCGLFLELMLKGVTQQRIKLKEIK